jgi:hypothetical protein
MVHAESQLAVESSAGRALTIAQQKGLADRPVIHLTAVLEDFLPDHPRPNDAASRISANIAGFALAIGVFELAIPVCSAAGGGFRSGFCFGGHLVLLTTHFICSI